MSRTQGNRFSRRSFGQAAGALVGGMLFGTGRGGPQRAHAAAADQLPRRRLGKAGPEVSALALGTWPSGMCRTIDTAAVASIVNEALDLGINYVDTAHNYDNAEEGIGKALGKRRKEVFLTTKVWADTAAEARRSFEGSLRALRTDHVDLLLLHSVGNRNLQRVLAQDGALSYLVRQKELGKTRLIGISGHSRVARFLTLINTGQIDVVMMAMNFVDRHTYGFEQKVLPAALERGMGVACMKVFGGLRGGFGVATGPNPGPQMDTNLLRQAVRYALGLPGVGPLVIGVHTAQQLRENVRTVAGYVPLSDEEQTQLAKLGRRLARQWGPHYGPVA